MTAIDLSHLAAQTGGDAALEAEVLRLFVSRAPADLELLKQAPPHERHDLAHRILGSARAIGAGEVARAAAAVESGTGEVEALAAAIAEACRFIAGHLAK